MQPSKIQKENAASLPCAKSAKAQSAIEYLTTYGWGILVVMIMLAVLNSFGVFNASRYATTLCTLPGLFSCKAILAANGNLLVNIGQSLASTITVTAIGCNTNSILSNTVMQNLAPTVSITNGGNATLITQCYENNTVTSKKIGNLYSGYLIVNYTNPSSSFTHTAIGTLIVRSTTQAVSTSTSSTTI